MNACQPRDAKEIVADILAIEEAITAMLEKATHGSVESAIKALKREDEMRSEIAVLNAELAFQAKRQREQDWLQSSEV